MCITTLHTGSKQKIAIVIITMMSNDNNWFWFNVCVCMHEKKGKKTSAWNEYLFCEFHISKFQD